MTHVIVIICQTSHFLSPNQFSDCPYPFPILCFFIMKTPSVTQRLVSQEKSKPNWHFRKIIGSNNSFPPIENNFMFFKIANVEFKVAVHSGLWAKCTQLWLLNDTISFHHLSNLFQTIDKKKMSSRSGYVIIFKMIQQCFIKFNELLPSFLNAAHMLTTYLFGKVKI